MQHFYFFEFIVKNIYLFLERCRKSDNVMVARFDAVRLFIFVLILWTLQSNFTLWLSARTLQCLFEAVCMPQYFRTLPGLDHAGLDSVFLYSWCSAVPSVTG